MTVLWFVTVAALLTAIVAWVAARRTARRLAQLSEMYWELKYQQAELRNSMLATGAARAPGAAAPPAAPPPAGPTETFVPLTSVRR